MPTLIPLFEVVNTAVTAINSHVVREIASDLEEIESDLWIVYMGNNEVYGPFGAWELSLGLFRRPCG